MRIVRCLLFICVASVFVTTSAMACSYNGVTYPTGTRIGGLVCQPDGNWKPA